VKVESFHGERLQVPKLDGFDAALDFQPDWLSLPSTTQPPRLWKLLTKLRRARLHPTLTNRVISYPETVASMLARPLVDYPRIPCVVPSWDNNARRRNGDATILHGSTPALYGHWLRSVLADRHTLIRLP